MIIAEFSVTPIGVGESVGKYVTRCIDIIDKSGLPYKLGPMGTCIEGEWEEVFALIHKCLKSLEKDCNRISISVKIDYRKRRKGGIDAKTKSIENRLGRNLKT